MQRNYGENMLNLALAKGYTKKLLENAKVVTFLNGNYRDMLSEFETLAAAEGVCGGGGRGGPRRRKRTAAVAPSGDLSSQF